MNASVASTSDAPTRERTPDALVCERPSATTLATLLGTLAGEFGDRVTTGAAVREQHSHGEGLADAGLPDVVVFPQTNEEVAAVVRLCHAAKVPVIAFGVGTSLEGHVAALYGGVCLDLSRMNRVLEVNSDDLDCSVQAGVTREQLNAELKGTGLFFPIDPGANATIGGMSATRASGTNAVRYGTMRENVLGLTVVTADGSIVHTGGRARKSSAGYDLTRLFVGNEGTLGVITEVRLRLYGIPEAIIAAVCQFPDLASATHTVITAMQMSIPVARIELLDDVQMYACMRYSKLQGYEVKPTLFFEFHGTTASAAEQSALMQQIAQEHGGGEFRWAGAAEERSALWKARHNAYYAALALKPGFQAFATDACVPISRLADCLLETRADVEREGMTAPIVGHVGDGNFHLVLLFDPTKAAERAKAEGIAARVSLRAIAMGGTCTGEHGIGVHKLDALMVEHGDAVDLMRKIKRALDPRNILNPGKTVPLNGIVPPAPEQRE
jgi:D-lactate dehydrogenase (cytochrome)